MLRSCSGGAPTSRHLAERHPQVLIIARTGTYIDTGRFVVTMIRDLLGVADPGRLLVTWSEAEGPELAARTRIATIRARRQSSRSRVLATCEKCGRDLRDPYSASVGIGPECIKSYHAEQVRLRRQINDAIRSGRLVHANAKPEATWHQQIVSHWIRHQARSLKDSGLANSETGA